MTTIRTHDHATIADAGDCPQCRQEMIGLQADGPYGWLLCFPDSKQIAVVRTWLPGDGPFPTPASAIEAAWATGCNTGGTVGGAPIDPVSIEASGVPVFTLLSGPDADAALARLGFDKPWKHDIVEACPCCDDPIVIGADGDEP